MLFSIKYCTDGYFFAGRYGQEEIVKGEPDPEVQVRPELGWQVYVKFQYFAEDWSPTGQSHLNYRGVIIQSMQYGSRLWGSRQGVDQGKCPVDSMKN